MTSVDVRESSNHTSPMRSRWLGRASDAAAERLGLSRTEYLRREITRVGQRGERHVTRADLNRIAELFADLKDDDVMRQAWS